MLLKDLTPFKDYFIYGFRDDFFLTVLEDESLLIRNLLLKYK